MESSKLNSELYSIIEDLHSFNHELGSTNNIDELRACMLESIFTVSRNLYLKSIEENYYWKYCSFLVYKNTHESRLTSYANRNDNTSEKLEPSFIEHEISSINSSLEYLYFKYFDSKTIEKVKIASESKINYLKAKLKSLQNNELQNDFNLDISDTSATDKIIYLSQLGVLDFLRTKSPFNMSINQLATVLSAITGEKTATLQPMLNPIFSTETNQKNNPLNKSKNTTKIKGTLNNIGFEPQKTN
jgi:hypothetical protein